MPQPQGSDETQVQVRGGHRADRYDVFLSHTSADAVAVERIASNLRLRGCAVFLSSWDLIPGEPWQEALEAALSTSRTCAVFLGPNGLGSWENEELRVALQLRANDPRLRVIPILLPGAALPERAAMPLFLSRHTWVDMRGGLDDERALARLVAGIRGLPPRPTFGRADDLESPGPFRGLASFRVADAEWFFGRESEVQQIIERLNRHRFLAVLGASGTGKSSVLHAGVLATLASMDRGDTSWDVVSLTPTAEPVEQLAIAIGAVVGNLSPTERLKELEAHPAGLRMMLEDAQRANSSRRRVLLFVDQFEELFSLCTEAGKRGAFVEALISAAQRGNTTVLLGMRADFVPACTELPVLADQISAYNFILTPMMSVQLQQVIDGPCQRAGLTLDDGLREELLNAVHDQVGALPLLQHTLFELWKRRSTATLTWAAYREIGDVRTSLGRTAERLYSALDSTDQLTLKSVVLALVQVQPGFRPTRRRVATPILQSVDQDSGRRIIATLVESRLLVSDIDAKHPTGALTLAHEALIEHWERLNTWIQEEQAFLQSRTRIEAAASEWESNERGGRLLLRGRDLVEAAAVVRARRAWLSELGLSFVEASTTARRRGERRLTMAAMSVGLLMAFYSAATAISGEDAIVRLGRVEGMSQAPTLNDQDRVLGIRLDIPARSDLVFMYYPVDPDKMFIKRVIAEELDKIRITDGRVFVNDVGLDEPYVPEEYRSHDDFGPQVVPEGQYFVLGDHRNNSSDSRHWGMVPRRYIRHKVVLRWWPLASFGRVR